MRIIHFSSLDREPIQGDSNSHFTVTLKNPIVTESKVVVLRLSIPKTYYNVREENHFTLIEGNQSVNIHLPPANYSIPSFRAKLQSTLTEKSPNGYIYTIDLNLFGSLQVGDTSKFVFHVSAIPTGNEQPRFAFNDTLYQQMGFNKFTSYQFEGGTLKAPNIYNMNIESVIYLNSDICKNFDDTVLQEVYTDEAISGNYIIFENKIPEHYMKEIDPAKSNQFKFSLTDIDGHVVNLNGAPINITLCLS